DADQHREERGGAEHEAEEEPSHERPTCRKGAGRLVRRDGAYRRGAARLETLGAEHGAIGPRREGHLTRTAAVAADDVMHALRSRGGAFGLRAAAAVRAAVRIVERARLDVELQMA